MKLLCTLILPGHASLRLLGLRFLTAWLSALDKSSEAGKDFAAECNKTDLLPKLLSQQQLDPPSSEAETIFRVHALRHRFLGFDERHVGMFPSFCSKLTQLKVPLR
jgi:hypothetical protein